MYIMPKTRMSSVYVEYKNARPAYLHYENKRHRLAEILTPTIKGHEVFYSTNTSNLFWMMKDDSSQTIYTFKKDSGEPMGEFRIQIAQAAKNLTQVGADK